MIKKILTLAGIAAPMLFLAGCIGCAVAVINDSDWLLDIGFICICIAALLIVVGMVAAILIRKYWVAAGGLLGLAIGAVLCFLTIVLIGAGQHHPPRQPEGVAMLTWDEIAGEDSTNIVRLSPKLERGSWWTDGQWFYQVTKTGQTIRMEGYGLHEGGAVCAFELDDDQLVSVMPKEGYTTYAKPGEITRRYKVTGDDGKTFELLLTYNSIYLNPYRVLQRCDEVRGDEKRMLAFVEQGMAALIAHTYNDYTDGIGSPRLWYFNEDGTVQMPDMDKPKPYTFELGYHMPTGVIRLPNGQRVGAVRGMNTLTLYRAEYDADEEYWTMTGDTIQTLYIREQAQANNWAYCRPALPGLLDFTDPDYQSQLHDDLEGELYPFSVLNYGLLPYTTEEEGEESEETETENEEE